MPSIPTVDDAPGLKIIPRADGTYRLLWRAPEKAVRLGYLPKSVSIDVDVRDRANHPHIRDVCQFQHATAEAWMIKTAEPQTYDGTIRSLSRIYQTHKSSPYRSVKINTKRLYDYELRLIESFCGNVFLKSIKATHFTEWHEAMKGGGDVERVRKAQSFIKRLRAIISFGIVAEVKDCERLDLILSKMQFDQPPRRRAVMTYDMAASIIKAAHDAGRPSIALAQAIQFETGLRQTDVIGQWEPCSETDRSPYRTGNSRWVPGLTWQNIDPDLVLSLDTSKTGSTVTHALANMPLVMAELELIPREKRIGPVIINENTSKPYLSLVFSRNWRAIADAAGVPSTIWNRDSRAGAISESDEAGADLSKIQRMAGHSNSKMTQRYVRGRAVETSAEIADLRAAKRKRNHS